ncbi:MAG TPA: diguanylate cyclase [Gaiellaceae bacterium]
MSFKFKLVLWFALLALLPLGASFYGFDTLAKRSETRRADATLEAALRSAVAGFGNRLDAAGTLAAQLAERTDLQNALRHRNRVALSRALRATPNAAVVTRGVTVGNEVAPAGRVTAKVVDQGRTLGRVIVSVPLGGAQLVVLGAGLPSGDRLIAARRGAVPLVAGQPAVATIAGKRMRALASDPLPSTGGIELAALAPESSIDAAAHATDLRVGIALLAALFAFAVAAYLVGSSVVASLSRLAAAANALARGKLDERVDVRGRDEFAQVAGAFNEMAEQLQTRLVELERARSLARDANERFGEALGATHDPNELLRIVVESAVEASGAVGGVVVRADGELARVGKPEAGAQRIAFPLRLGMADFGSLVVSGASFDADQVEAVASIATRVVVALENARLHRIVERQAMHDELTGLANRRSVESTLAGELARAERFGESVCFVLADLDDFKAVNDTHGHPFGDDALRAFAAALLANVREVDLAGRWGGEEFALVLPGTDAAGGVRLAERARKALESHPMRTADGRAVVLTASFGVAAFPDWDESGEIVAAADSALYAAKRSGKNRVVLAAESTVSGFD